MRWLYVALAAGGCASAGRDTPQVGSPPDGGAGNPAKDGGSPPAVDAAPLPDAPPGQTQVTLAQTTDMTPAGGAGIACVHKVLANTVATADNSWYRVFKLSDYGITGAFNVQRVTFWTDYAWAGTGVTQPATIKVGTYSGALDADTLSTAAMTTLASKSISIDDNYFAPVQVAIDVSATIPAGTNLVVELALPDGLAAGNYFYIAVSAGGEQHDGYIRAMPAGCPFNVPTSLTSPTALAIPDNSILLTVTGTK